MVILFEYEANGVRTTEVLIGCVQYILEVACVGNALGATTKATCTVRRDWSVK